MKTMKDLPTKSPAKVKGGKIAINDNMTLVLAANERPYLDSKLPTR